MIENKIELKGFKTKDWAGIYTGESIEMTQQHSAVIAECILQVIYNLAVQSKMDIEYDMSLNGTKYLIHGTDVTIINPNGDSYKRRIKNDRSLVSNYETKDNK